MTSECDNLDAYLGDDLQVDAATRFLRHLDQCAGCRENVELQRWIDGLLSSDACAALEPAPAALRDTLRASISRGHRRGPIIACGLVAAAMLAIVAAGWTLKLNREADGPLTPTTGHITAPINPVNPKLMNAAPPQATFVSNGDTIAVPVGSSDDNVTIVQLYPTTETKRRWRRELTLQFLHSETDGS